MAHGSILCSKRKQKSSNSRPRECQDCLVAQQQINQYHEELTGSTLELGGADANSDDWWTSEWWDAAMSLANDWFPTATEPPKKTGLPMDLDGLGVALPEQGLCFLFL